MWWMFEFVIFFYLIVSGAFLIQVAVQWKEFKHKRLRSLFAFIIALGWLMIFYGSLIEPKTLAVREQTIELSDDSASSIRAVALSDLHMGPYKDDRWAKQVVETVMAQQPEIIFILGDFIFNDPTDVSMLSPLSGLTAPLGVYAVTGNHDNEAGGVLEVIETLEGFGITVLENQQTKFSVEDQEIVLAGVSDIWFGGSPEDALADLDEEQTVVLLAHNPDVILYSSVSVVDLVIAGHTHGGQIRLPWIGSLVRVPTQLGNDYDKGLFDYALQQLFITAGVSETGPRARLFNPPEISVLQIEL